jgi:sec-independent protein translocase protein TatB
MAGEFQGHVDEMIRDADLGDVKSTFDELRQMNLKATVQRAIDPDNSMRAAFADPFRDRPVRPVMAPLDQPALANEPKPIPSGRSDPPGPAPAFIPPGATPPAAIQPSFAPAPAFIPPSVSPAENRA